MSFPLYPSSSYPLSFTHQLLAFQQKKKKKGKHKKKAASSSVDVSLSGDVDHAAVTAPAALSASLGVIDLHSDSTGLAKDVPPVPSEDHVNGPEQSIVQLSTSVPPVSLLARLYKRCVHA